VDSSFEEVLLSDVARKKMLKASEITSKTAAMLGMWVQFLLVSFEVHRLIVENRGFLGSQLLIND